MDVAFKLEQVLGIPASLWLEPPGSNYRAERKRATQREHQKSYAAWMRKFPFREMVRCEYLGDVGSDVGARVDALLTFFGVTSEDAWSKEWAHATGRFRKSPEVCARSLRADCVAPSRRDRGAGDPVCSVRP